jgi:Cu(I)/Ag(I) efflux system membrane protein CusA/SilA
LAVLSCVPIVSRLGGEFLPRLDDGNLLFMPTTLPGVPPVQAQEQLARQDRAIAPIRRGLDGVRQSRARGHSG